MGMKAIDWILTRYTLVTTATSHPSTMCWTAVSNRTGAEKFCERYPGVLWPAVLLRDTGGFRPLSHHCQKLADLTAVALDH